MGAPIESDGINPDTGLFEDGAIVVVSSEGCWDGEKFVRGWGAAKKYRPCTPDFEQGIAEAERATGKRCVAFCLQP